MPLIFVVNKRRLLSGTTRGGRRRTHECAVLPEDEKWPAKAGEPPAPPSAL
jgi:hypothetical protein